MRRVLADSGFFIGLFDPRDAHHEACRRFLDDFDGCLVTTWAVFTEVSAFLPRRWQHSFFGSVSKLQAAGRLKIESPPEDAIMALWESMEKYEDLPMDFCDATLVYSATQGKITEIATADRRDFSVYRLPGNRRFELVLESYR